MIVHNNVAELWRVTVVDTGLETQIERRFGVFDIDAQHSINRFTEKDKEDGGWINGGFMVLEPEVFDYIENYDNAVFERATLEKLARDGQLMAFKHTGFLKCMDTLRDKETLEYLYIHIINCIKEELEKIF